ncbi:hypothetical protein CLG96_12760 [Sphingomonas oleivorans]|uniref:Transmembrane anchor protein n=1 Tax=Sphingomonas oleivorans TaxID=1735121 RepID=A0A2T5FW70_9SPHN|nr:hypothetical protein [Sphingomonas oleivorans]PTQ10009.1 hypothetical protein CLG96_12760 [Sphingomonas oleivorans]
MSTVPSSLPYQTSPRTLARASLAALAAGAAIVTLFVLPAEYGIDPTGIGGALGLTRMAGGEADEGADTPAVPAAAAAPIPEQNQASIAKATPLRSDEKVLTLAPHSGIEVKARMKTGDHFVFRWQSTGPVRMDMHGEPTHGPEGEFSTYWKQKDLSEAQGAFTAPFDGTHGWYWRNRGETPVTIRIKTSGFYTELFEPPAE